MRQIFSLAILCAAATAQSGIVILDRNSSVVYSVYPNSPTDTGGSSSFSANFQNHLAFNWWYYAVAGDTTGSVFNTANNQMTASRAADGRSALFEWSNVDSRGFSAKMLACVYSTGSSTGISTQRMEITNNTTAPLVINLYAYADIDVGGLGADDSAAQMVGYAAGNTRVSDASATTYFLGANHANWQAAAWPTLRDGILATAPTLSNAGLPFGPGDYSGAFQWTLTIPPGQSARANSMLSITALPRSTAVSDASTYGNAKPGTPPGLSEWTLNRPFSGTSANLQITNGLTGSAPIAVIGSAQTNLPLPGIGTVYVTPIASFSMPAFNASGISAAPIAIPPIQTATVYFQALWVDAGAANSIAHSNGLTWVVGGF
jgi:hypothetical protein